MTYVFLVTEILSANGICTQAVMTVMVNRGHRVICLTNRDRDLSKLYVRDGVEYHTIRPRLVYAMQQRGTSMTPSLMRNVVLALTWAINKVKLLLAVGTWPLVSPSYTYRYYSSLAGICARNRVDAIIPVYSQIDTLIAAYCVKKKYANMLVTPYMLDSLSGGYGPKVFSRDWMIRRGLKWEDRLFHNADRIFVMESTKAHHIRHSADTSHYQRIVYLDLPLMVDQPRAEWFQVFDGQYVNMLYLGTIPAHIRRPNFLLDVFSQIEDPSLKLYFIGPIENDYICKRMREDKRIYLLPAITHGERIKALQSANVLINLGNNQPNMTPSKIFEYISTGKPIVSTSCIDDDPSAKYLRRYPLSLVLSEKETDFKHVAGVVHRFIRSALDSKVPFEVVNSLYSSNAPQRFVDYIENFILKQQSV